MPRHQRKHPSGKLKGVTLKRVRNLLDQYDFNLPGHCLYKSPQQNRPDILKAVPLPHTCTRAECEEALHFYNHKKRRIYDAIMAGNSYSSISRRIKVANSIRWQIVIINMGIIYRSISKNPKYEDFLEALVYHMHQTVDRFNPNRGFAPSTYFTAATKYHIWKVQNGNANQKNMNIIMASEMDLEGIDMSFQSVFDAKTASKTTDMLEKEINLRENRERIAVLMDSIEDERDRRVINLRFFSAMTLEAIAGVLGLTRERVRQLEIRALSQMRLKANQVLCHSDEENHQP